MKVVVGGPVSHREWVLPLWFEHVERAADHAGIEVDYLHVGCPERDEETFDIIRAHGGTIVSVLEPERQDVRDWGILGRYQHLTDLRNTGLRAVRDMAPEYFLSVDSDILLDERTIASLIEAHASHDFDAVGGKCYMNSDPNIVSYGMWNRDGGIQRQDVETGLFGVQVIMAIKLMSPVAYSVDYLFNMGGEDLGWSRNAAAAGVKLGWDARTVSKHIFDRRLLTEPDRRIGW